MRRLIERSVSIATAAMLVGLILTHSFAAYLDTVGPDWASSILSTEPSVELNIAANLMMARTAAVNGDAAGEINAAITQTDGQIRERIKHALYNEPVSARGFELLGALSADSGDSASAGPLMQAAVRRSLRSPAALYWLMQHKLAASDMLSSAQYADTLLRIRPASMPYVGRALMKIGATPDGANELTKILGGAPVWRSAFFRFLNAHTEYANIGTRLLLGLKSASHPPTDEEIDPYIWALAKNRKFELAYYTWLQFLPASKAKTAKLLFNGDFRFTPSAVPFDWSIDGGNGVIAEIDPDTDLPERNILSLELGGGRVDFRPISQLLVLPPGHYIFSGISKGELDGPRGLRWQAVCLAPDRTAVAASPMLLGTIPEWVEFTKHFEIPPGCAAQMLQLILDARSPSETIVSGSMAFADLKLLKDEAASN